MGQRRAGYTVRLLAPPPGQREAVPRGVKGETQRFYNAFFDVFGVRRRNVTSRATPILPAIPWSPPHPLDTLAAMNHFEPNVGDTHQSAVTKSPKEQPSYRERDTLGRLLNHDEVRYFSETARRINTLKVSP